MNRPARPQVKATVGGKAPVAARAGRAARLPHGGDARRRNAVGGGDQAPARAVRRARLHPRQVGRNRPRATEPDARSVRGDRAARRRRRPVVRRGDAPAGGRRHFRGCRPTLQATPTGARPWPGRGSRKTLAELRHPDGRARVDPGAIAPRHAAALSAGRCAMAPSARAARTRRLSRRRHGSRQDHPGPVAAAGAERAGRRQAQAVAAGGAGLAARQLGRGNRPLRAEPEGGRGPSIGHAGGEAEVGPSPTIWRMSISSSPATAFCRACLAGDDALAARGSRRGAGHQEPGRQADPDGQAAARPTRASR